MLNQVKVVGRISKLVKNNEEVIVSIVIPRNFKNNNGEYDNDVVDVYLRDNLAKQTIEYCKNGDLIGIKGKLSKLENENEVKIIAEKVTMLNRR